jgi:YD repeat-containing protein
VERFSYYPSGRLKQKWQADGTSIQYVYDPKGRLIRETTFDSQRVVVKEERMLYQGPLLQAKIDGMGVTTTYTYDHVGRKIQETIGDLKIIHYAYDGFGRVIKIEQEGQQEIYEYDGCDRVISKTWQDCQGHVFAKKTYAFDFQGNQTKKTLWQTYQHRAVYGSDYHSDGTLNGQTNPLNHRTQWQYHHQHLNEAGQRVQLRTILDPLGRPTIEMDDPLHRLAKREVLDEERKLSSMQFAYDAAGHCIKEQASVMADGQFLRDYWVERSYNSRGLLEWEKEMPAGKTFSYQYDAMGYLQKKTKPDGVEIFYTYDPLGRIKTLTSSDHTLAYTYLYDGHDNIIQVQDHVHHFTQNRSFDPWDRLIQEEILPGIFLHYTYDALDRLIKMSLPDGSTVSYCYDAYHLKKIQRFNLLGEQVYDIHSMP